MKKLIALLLCICLALSAVPVSAENAAEPGAAPKVTSKNFPVYSYNLTTVWRNDFPVYFLNGVEDLPFINLEDWKDLLVYIFNDIDPSGGNAFSLTISVAEDGKRVTLTRETGYTMVVDFEAGTLEFMDYVAFIQPAWQPYMDVTGAPLTKDGEPFLLQYTQARNLYGNQTVVDLKKHGIPMAAQDGKYLLPMQTLSAFTLLDMSIGVYYNRQALFLNVVESMAHPRNTFLNALSESGLLGTDLMEKTAALEGTVDEKFEALLKIISEASPEGKELVDAYRASLEGNLYMRYADVPKVPRSDELIEYGFRELALELDCFYGLKESHNITDFSTFFLQNEIGVGLADPDASKADQAVADLTQYWFDDGHSGFISSSCLSDTDTEYKIGFNVNDSSNLQTGLSVLRSLFPNAGQPYYEVGDTAYVTLDGFSITPEGDSVTDYYKLVREGGVLPDDTVKVIYEAHQQITRENSPINNVVLDLSINGGGMAYAALYVLGWYLGDANYSLRNTFTGAQTTRYFKADVNLDHQFDKDDTLAGRGLNLYCLISGRSFSCGNLVPWVFKADGTVTLLGKTSGGGSCVVGYGTTAWGTSYQYSSPKRLAFVKNGAYYDVDKGVEPDHVIDSYAHFYNRETLTDFIHGLY